MRDPHPTVSYNVPHVLRLALLELASNARIFKGLMQSSEVHANFDKLS